MFCEKRKFNQLDITSKASSLRNIFHRCYVSSHGRERTQSYPDLMLLSHINGQHNKMSLKCNSDSPFLAVTNSCVTGHRPT